MSYKILGESGIVSYSILGQPKGKIAYSSKVLNTQPDNLIQYLPFSEPAGSVNAIDLSPEGNDGVYNTVTLGVPGIGDGLTAARLNGVAGFVNIYSAALNADFDGAEGTMLMYCKVANAGVWTNGVSDAIAVFRSGDPNQVYIKKHSVNNQIVFLRRATATNEILAYTTTAPTDWFFVAMTWSETADEVKMYYKDDATPFAQVGITENGLGAFVGDLNTTQTNVGATFQTNLEVFDGDLAHWAVWNTPLTENELRQLSIR